MVRGTHKAMRLLLLLVVVISCMASPLQIFCENTHNIDKIDQEFTRKNTLSRWRLSSNAIPFSLTILNAGAEFLVTPKFSVEIPVFYCPWTISRNFSIRTLAVQPEVRYWFNDVRRGHYLGIHANVAQFNVLIHHDRYQDAKHPLLGAGISYGYLLPINARWSARFSLGVGYCFTQYQRFYNIANGALIDNRSTHYIGVDMIGISITYNL